MRDDYVLDIGCGYLPEHKRRKGIAVDLHRGKCDLTADAQNLPFKSNIFAKVYALALLEHLEKPYLGLQEILRVLRKDGTVFILIPRWHNPCIDECIKLMLGFPLRLITTISRLRRWHKHRFEKGFWHKNCIKLRHIKTLFQVKQVIPYHPKHDLNRGRIGKLLTQLRFPLIFYPADSYYIIATRAL